MDRWGEEAIRVRDAEIERLRKEATACVASIRTRTGQIEKAQANYTANSFYQIDAAVHQIKQAADDLRRALDHGIVRAALEQKGDGK